MRAKRILAQICLLWALMPPAAVQAQFTFTTNDDAITITGYTGSDGTGVIPDSTNGYPVSAIADYAFWGTSTLTNLTIPGSVTNIGVMEFQVCSGLTNVTVDGANPNYASAGGALFDKAMATLLQYPGGLAGSYTIPNGVTNIANYAFEYCYQLSGVTIPNTVTSIGDWAFSNTGLTSATIPASVTNMSNNAFTGGGPLAIITVDGANPKYASAGGVLFNKALTTLMQCPSGRNGGYTIPGSVTNIGDSAFMYSSLSSVTIPSSVIGIGYQSFWNDNNLTTVAIPDSVTSIGGSAFYACYGLKSVTLGSGVASIGYQAFSDCSALTNFTVAGANPNYASAGGVLFDKGITTLLQCPAGLTSYAIPNGVTSIADNAFYSCYNLTNMTIGSSVASIGQSAFYNCSRLTSVTIPNNVGGIGWEAFGNCYHLANVTIGSGVTNIGGYAFAWCSALRNIMLGSGVTSITYDAFYGCSSLTTVTIPASVTSIGSSCFLDCAKLTQVYFQGDAPLVDGWEAGSADTSVFSGETGTVYYVPGTAGWDTSFGGWFTAAFVPFAYIYITNIDNTITITGCTGISGDNITIPDTINGLTVASIGAGAFQHNSSLTNITIPASVISLGSLAFSDCTNLTEIHFLGNAPTADLTVFSGDNHAIVYYPPGATGWSSPFDGLLAGQLNPPSPAGDFYYTTINGAITITGYNGAGGDIGIPSTINGLTVVGIADGAFDYNYNLTSVTIPNSVTNIGNYPFYDCGHLTSVTIGNGVTSIGYSAFGECWNLTNVMIGKSVTSIGDWAFEDSGSPLVIDCLGNAPQADWTVFDGDDPATIYYLPDTTGWSSWHFAGLTTVLWTAPVTPVTLTYTYITNSDNTIPITRCTGAVGDVTIPGTIHGLTVASIANGAFQYNGSLTSITIPATITSLGSLAFSDCTNLTEIYFLGNAPGANLTVFAGDYYAIVYYPPGTTGWSSPFDGLLAGQQNPPAPAGDFDCDTINGTITITGYHGAGGDIGIPDTINGLPVVGIGDDAFDSYDSLTSVTIPDSVTNIGAYAFEYCDNLTSVTIGNGVTSIGFAAFDECWSLTNVMIGKNVTQIGDWAFEDSGSPLTIDCLGNAPHADSTVFSGDDPATIYYLPDTTGWSSRFAGITAVLWTAPAPPVPFTSTYITNSDNTITITGCSGGGDATIPDTIDGLTVTGIANGAFQHNHSLTSITIPAGIINLGSAAFADCTNLTGIYFLGDAPGADLTVFAGDNHATIYYLPDTAGWSSPFDGLLAELQNPVAPAGDFTYTTTNGTIIITGYTGTGGNIGIPRTITGLPVVSIEDYAFEYISSLTSVTIPNNVTNIGEWAFYDCQTLTSVILGNNVTRIGEGAFYGCNNLTNATIGNSVALIGDYPFSECSSLTAITVATLNSSYSSVDGVLFNEGQTLLIEFPVGSTEGDYTMPDSVSGIEEYAFEDCTGLTNVTMGNDLLAIGMGAFWGCNGLTTVAIPNNVTSIGQSAFGYCSGLTNVTLGNSVASIGDGAFWGCSGLATIAIPASVWSIEDDTFYDCSGLTVITVDPANLYYCSPNGVLLNHSQTTLIQYPEAKAGSYTIPSSVTSLAYSAFNYCTNLTSLTIGNNIASIGNYQFDGCTSLASVTIGNGVTNLGYDAFADCTSLASVTIPGHVTSIGSEAFEGDISLTNVMIPASVTSIGSRAFLSGPSLIAIKVDPSNPVYSSLNGVLFDVSQSTLIQFPGGVGGSYTIPATVTNIADFAFGYSPNLARVTIPDNVLSIGDAAFASCYGLTNATIGNGVTSIPEAAFINCPLTSVSIGTNVISIGDNAFAGCPLTSITIPNSVTSIGYQVFADNSSLTNLILGNSLTNIGQNAFSFCTHLATVTFPASLIGLGDGAFYYCTNLTGAYFLGDVPGSRDWFQFYYDSLATVYCLPGATGWTSQFGTRPVVQWILPPQISPAGLGVQANQFGFNLTGFSGQVVVVEACTGLANPDWQPVGTNSLTGGAAYFSDPQWANYPVRYYRVHTQ
jgi:hypothetical protein